MLTEADVKRRLTIGPRQPTVQASETRPSRDMLSTQQSTQRPLLLKQLPRATTTFPLAGPCVNHESAEDLGTAAVAVQLPEVEEEAALPILSALEQLVQYAKHLDDKISDLQVASLRSSANLLTLDSSADQDRWAAVLLETAVKPFQAASLPVVS